MSKLFIFTFSCFAFVVSCSNFTAKNQRGLVPQPPIVTDQNMCSRACDNLTKLKCPESQPIKLARRCSPQTKCDSGQSCVNGNCTVPCVTFCIQTQNVGVWLNPSCVANIRTCNDIDACTVTKK